MTVLFTGFDQGDIAYLEARAQRQGMTVSNARKVLGSLDILVCGDNPGPSKLADAAALGVPVLDRAGFYNLLDTGKLPG